MISRPGGFVGATPIIHISAEREAELRGLTYMQIPPNQ